MHESLVRKAENTLNSLECSFCGVDFRSVGKDETSVAGSRWVLFGAPFGELDGPGQASSKKIPKTSTDAFDSSVFVGLDNMNTPKKASGKCRYSLASGEIGDP
jgi:hypothetical protein